MGIMPVGYFLGVGGRVVNMLMGTIIVDMVIFLYNKNRLTRLFCLKN